MRNRPDNLIYPITKHQSSRVAELVFMLPAAGNANVAMCREEFAGIAAIVTAALAETEKPGLPMAWRREHVAFLLPTYLTSQPE